MKSREIAIVAAGAGLALGVGILAAQDATPAQDPANGIGAVAPEAGDTVLPPPLDTDGVPMIEVVDDPEVQSAPQASQAITRDTVITLDQDFQPAALTGIVMYRDTRRSVSERAGDPPARGAGVHILEGLTTPDPERLREKLQGRIGKQASYKDLEEIVAIILDHYKAHNRPMTHVYIPIQNFSTVIRFAVIEGTVGNAYVLTQSELRDRDPASLTPREASFARRLDEGSWWQSWYQDPYKSDDLKRALEPRLEPLRGRALDTEELKAQLAAVNRSPWARLNRPVEHPFREVEVVFSPPARDVLGETDLVFEIQDSRPLKFFAGWENNLTELLGDDRLFLGAAWYDAFMLGRDHQLGVQLFSALDPDELLGISGSYAIPWTGLGHYTELYAAYAESSAEILVGGIPVDVGGTNLLLGARHYYALPGLFGTTDFTQPLARDANPYPWADARRESFGFHHEVGGGVDFKSTDNDLTFGGTTVANNPADIFQFVLEYNARQTDPTGETNLAWQTFYSPGGITGDNNDASFAPLRFGASAEYLYTRVKLTREQDLPYEFMAKAALTGQWADGNLMASEQVGLGGYGTVRGYKERIHRGDYGYFLNLELYSPAFSPSQDWFNQGYNDSLRFLTFFDVGHAGSVDDNPADLLDDSQTLMSVGVGLRYEFDNDLRIRLDYGFQLEDPIPAANTKDGGALHFGAVWTF